MAEEADQISKIQTALHRARRRWLLAATINAGGRWAVLPAAAAALTGIVLSLAGVESLAWLLPVSLLGLAGAVAALLATRAVYAKPGASGAPDWALLLDRSLGLHDALPAWLEADGSFKGALASAIAPNLDPVRERAAAPAKRWAGLVLALILGLMPLIFWRPDATPETPPEDPATNPVAQVEPPPPPPPPPPPAGDDSGEGEPQDGGEGDGKGEGETQRPPNSGTGGGAGEKPDDAEPAQPDDPSRPQNDGAGNQPENPPEPEPAKPPGRIEDEIKPIAPPAGDGETRTERRSRWVYNPDGEGLDESTPTPRIVPGRERVLPRTRATSSERKLVEDVYRKLYE